MIFALSGVHGSGKTTTLNALRSIPSMEVFSFYSELTRHLKDLGFDINEKGTDKTQLAVTLLHFQNILDAQKKHIVVDRSLLDGYVYSKYLYMHGSLDKSTFDLIQGLYETNISQYSLIFLFTPFDEKIENDGVRSTSPLFHKEIQSLFEEESKTLKKLIVPVPQGSVADRSNFIETKIFEYGVY